MAQGLAQRKVHGLANGGVTRRRNQVRGTPMDQWINQEMEHCSPIDGAVNDVLHSSWRNGKYNRWCTSWLNGRQYG